MTIPSTNGIFDGNLNYVICDNEGTWDDLTTWDSFVQWPMSPLPLIWAVEPIDLGTIKTFNLRIIANANGNVSYRVFTSDTGLFEGEETITTIANDATSVPAFSGKVVWIEVTVTNETGVPLLYGIEYAVSESPNALRLNDVDTSTLSGTSAERTLTFSKTIGGVTNIQITPKTVTAYAVDLYVSNTPTSTTVIPRVISKTSPVKIALVGIDNQPRDAVVDIVVEYLPEGYMSNNNLLLR